MQGTNRYYIKKLPDQPLGLGIVPNGIINQVDRFSPAEKAGLKKGLKITHVNDQNVKEKDNKTILKMIKENENYLVIDAVIIYNYQATQEKSKTHGMSGW